MKVISNIFLSSDKSHTEKNTKYTQYKLIESKPLPILPLNVQILNYIQKYRRHDAKFISIHFHGSIV